MPNNNWLKKPLLRLLLILPLFVVSTLLSMLAISLIMADRETAVGYGFIVGMIVSLILIAIISESNGRAVFVWILVSVIVALTLSYGLFRFSSIIHAPSIVTFCLTYVLPLLIATVTGSITSAHFGQIRK